MAEKVEIQSASDFGSDKRGLAQRWGVELEAARKDEEKWHTQADAINKRFLGKDAQGSQRVNLFTANVQTQRAMLYGKTPSIECKRRFDDAKDDVARVASEILERLLNADVVRDGDGYRDALALALDDKLLPGLGQCRLRYEADFDKIPGKPAMVDPEGNELAPAVPEQEVKTREDVITDHVNWRDFRWSPARTWAEVRWVAFRSYLTREQVAERYGKKAAKDVALSSKSKRAGAEDKAEPFENDPWSRAEVWEIWDRADEKVIHFSPGCPYVLDVQDDPLGLDGFFPCPRPLVANLTTDAFIPTPDFVIAQDIYNEVDSVSARITLLERAIRVAGIYDASSSAVQALVSDQEQNVLIPVDGWQAFIEKGGIANGIAWMPLAEVVQALDKLREYRSELIGLAHQITGMSDIMRGEASSQATATEQAIKARFASVRMEYAQGEFRRFATDIQRLRAQIICQHFDETTIRERANVNGMYDDNLISAAIAALREDSTKYRIEVKPDSINLADYAALQQERTQFMGALTGFLQSATPMIQAFPESAIPLVEILRWVMTSFRGSSSIEGVMDVALDMVKKKLSQPPPPPQPDPKAQAIMMKAQTDVQVAKQKGQIDMAKGVMDLKFKQANNQMDMAAKQQQMALDSQKQRMQFGAQMARDLFQKEPGEKFA